MKRIKLTREEKKIEDALLKGEYMNVSKAEFNHIAGAIAMRRKDAVLNLRINSGDLENLKHKADKLGVRYQTFISEILHRIAQN
jgi:predicted DNA binding CopG/RHH family protein